MLHPVRNVHLDKNKLKKYSEIDKFVHKCKNKKSFSRSKLVSILLNSTLKIQTLSVNPLANTYCRDLRRKIICSTCLNSN